MDFPHENCFENVLLVGEGNFSFTEALLNLLSNTTPDGSAMLTSTSYDERDYIINRYYDGCEEVLLRLEKNANCSVIHGVDATKLERYFPCQRFDLILFNFPHHDGKGKIQKNRRLLEDFFKSAKSLVIQHNQNREEGFLSEIRVTLARGQGGTEADEEQRVWGNSWQVVEQAAKAGLVLKGVTPFESEMWHNYGYRCCGRRSQGKGTFATEGALVHTFVCEGMGVPCMFPVTYTHDISFWYGEVNREAYESGNPMLPDFNEELLQELIQQYTLGFVQSIEFQEFYISEKKNDDNENHKVSRSYRLCYRSNDDRSLSKGKTVSLQLNLRNAIEQAGLGSFKG